MNHLIRLVVALGFVLGILGASVEARAEANGQLTYSKQQVYSTALRYLRIELRHAITERDPDAAYLLFEYQPLGQKTLRFGAIEIVEQTKGVRLVVRLPDQPSYQETVLREGLVRKLEADYGVAPSPSEKPTAPRKTPSEDKDAAKGSNRPNDRSPDEPTPPE